MRIRGLNGTGDQGPSGALGALHRPIQDARERGLDDVYQDHKTLLKSRLYVAEEARRLHGETVAGYERFLAIMAEIIDKTTWCTSSFRSPTAHRKGHPLSKRALDKTWAYVCAHPRAGLGGYLALDSLARTSSLSSLESLVFDIETRLIKNDATDVRAMEFDGKQRRRMGTKKRRKLAESLAVELLAWYGYAVDKGLSPDCFAATYLQGEELTGIPRRTLFDHMAVLVRLGFMVRHPGRLARVAHSAPRTQRRFLF